ncbi:unnamed protein product [Paramecium pentaurelia]|uniref:Uncharacterized protein n=1 Tax=Paramecium pentaurelia TaxID=43138 RepID=A0A8S1U9E3_9CILI|nr:unnamed protein product [Paramecium pentaurelia]
MQNANLDICYYQVNVFNVQSLVSSYMKLIQVVSTGIHNLLLLDNHQLILWMHKILLQLQIFILGSQRDTKHLSYYEMKIQDNATYAIKLCN